jgi:hypothetical protein
VKGKRRKRYKREEAEIIEKINVGIFSIYNEGFIKDN